MYFKIDKDIPCTCTDLSSYLSNRCAEPDIWRDEGGFGLCCSRGPSCACPLLCSLLQSWPLEPAFPPLPGPLVLCCTWPKEGRGQGFPGGTVVKNPPANVGGTGDTGAGKILWNRTWQPTPVFLPGKPHGQRSLMGYSPWDCKESDMTVWLISLHICYMIHMINSTLNARYYNYK